MLSPNLRDMALFNDFSACWRSSSVTSLFLDTTDGATAVPVPAILAVACGLAVGEVVESKA